MNSILVDSSVWIDYFKGGKQIDVELFERYIDNNQICINEIILAELIPALALKNEIEVIDILKSITLIPFSISWNKIIEYQIMNLKNGINKVGIPDLLIAQNVIQNSLTLYSLDKHFKLMSQMYKFKII